MATIHNSQSSSRALSWQAALLQLGVIGTIWFFSSLPGIAHYIYGVLAVSSDRPWAIVQSYLESHPYTALFCSSVIFLGPISFVLPLVILQDTYIYAWLNFIHLFHGYMQVWNCARYYHSSNALDFAPGVGGIFASLEWMAAVYNTWTTKQKPLLVFRVLAAAVGIYIVFTNLSMV